MYADCSKQYFFFFSFLEKNSYETQAKPEPKNISFISSYVLQLLYQQPLLWG